MRQHFLFAFVLLAFAPLALADDSITIRLEAVPQANGPSGPFADYKPLRIPLSDTPPKKLVREPKYASAKPLYGSLALGNDPDAQMAIVLDEAETGKRSLLYVDANNDGDLANDGDGNWSRENEANFIADHEIVVRYVVDGKRGTAPYFIRFYRLKDFTNREVLRDKVLCYRANHREGKITLAGREYRLCIADDDTDGRFDDLDGGTVAIDINGDGKLDGSADSAESFPLAEPFNVNGTAWKVLSVSPAGDSITLAPAGRDVPVKPALEPGNPAPPFQVSSHDGQPIDLEQLHDRIVVIIFWSIDSGPSKEEIAKLIDLYAHFKDGKFAVIGICLDEKPILLTGYRAAHPGIDWLNVCDGNGAKGAIAKLYRVRTLPAVYVLDQNGWILHRGPLDAAIIAKIGDLVGKAPPTPVGSKPAGKSGDGENPKGNGDAGGPGGTPGEEGLAALKTRFNAERTRPAAQRLAALAAIGALGTKEAAEFLRWVYAGETDPVIRFAVVEAFGANGTPEAFRALLSALDAIQDDPTLKAAIARAMGGFPTPEALKKLLAVFAASKKDDGVRLAVAQALSGFRAAEFAGDIEKFFFDALKDPSVPVLAEALKFLAPKKDARVLATAKELLTKSSDPAARKAAVEPLRAAGTQDAFLALFEAAGREKDTAAKQAMIEAMLAFSDPGVIRWVAAQGIGQKDPALRRVAVTLLGRSNDPAALKTLLQALHDPDRAVRLATIYALADLSSQEASAELLRVAGEEDVELAAAAIESLGLLGLDTPAVVSRLIGFLKARSTEIVLAAAAALARVQAKDAGQPLIALLGHEAWQVRAGAIEALVHLRCKEAILPLINRLEKEDGRLRQDLVAALQSLTGMKLGADVPAWRKWWADQGGAFVPPPETREAGSGLVGDTTYYGIPVVSKRICFLLDISDSMNEKQAPPGTHTAIDKTTRLEIAKKELLDTLDRLAKDVRFNLIFFNDGQVPWQKELQPADPAHKLEARKFIAAQRPRGGTNIFDPLATALADPNVDTVFLLSDGLPVAGRFIQTEDILREIRGLNRSKKVVIHTICIGEDNALMQELAKQSGGKHIQR